jgi:hypothetical protein
LADSLDRRGKAQRSITPSSSTLACANLQHYVDRNLKITFLALMATLTVSQTARAGPPYITDDPEPVELHDWEVIVSFLGFHDTGGWTGQAPFLDVNYGAFDEVQLHIAPSLALSSAPRGPFQFGYGDTELGVKYRFVEETPNCPQIAIYPLLEVPTGDANRSLGSGNSDAFLPLWIEKNFGPWTAYGGGGYWINPGADNKNWGYVGGVVQRKLMPNLTLGVEAFYETPRVAGGTSNTVLNFGGGIDLSDTYHILFSAGHTVQGASAFDCFLGLQITFGPKAESK